MTDDQALLLDASARFIEDTLPSSRIREIADGADVGDGHRAGAADLGWFAMFVDEDLGGGSVSGDPVNDAVLLGRLRGTALLPPPFVATNTVAAILGARGSDEQQASVLPDLAAGKCSAAMAVAGDALWGGRLYAEESGGDLVLRGAVVLDDPGAQWVLLTAFGSDGLCQMLVEASELGPRTRLDCLDLTRRLDRVDLDGVRIPAAAVVVGGVDEVRTLATVLSVAESVGTMERLFDLTRQYSLDRIAFGRPIGSFQALKHLIADISLVVESAKAVLVAAGRAVAEQRPYAGEVAAIAATYVGERAATMAQDCLQVHGGIGFAWEHDLHLYLRRLTTDAALSGAPDFHRGLILAAHSAELEATR